MCARRPVDLTGVRSSLGISSDIEQLSYRDIQERRKQLRESSSAPRKAALERPVRSGREPSESKRLDQTAKQMLSPTRTRAALC